jgi:hypothetical protein
VRSPLRRREVLDGADEGRDIARKALLKPGHGRDTIERREVAVGPEYLAEKTDRGLFFEFASGEDARRVIEKHREADGRFGANKFIDVGPFAVNGEDKILDPQVRDAAACGIDDGHGYWDKYRPNADHVVTFLAVCGRRRGRSSDTRAVI